MARVAEDDERQALRIYATDELMNIAENTAKQAAGKYLSERWIDIVDPKPVDKRTAADIAEEFVTRHGLTFAR